MLKALVQGRVAVPYAGKLRERLGEAWAVETFDPEHDPLPRFAQLAAEAFVVIGGASPIQPWPAMPEMKLFQIPWAGYEFCSPTSMPAGIPVCNCYEHETTIAEYVLAAILEWQVGLRDMDSRFRVKGWDGKGPGMAHFHSEVRGRTLGIIGYGHIGFEVARRANAFDMRVCGIRRQTVPTPPELAWLGTLADLDQLLAESDFVLVACDLNEETAGLIDAHRLAKMKSDGVIINVSRGGVIVEDALYEALHGRQIGGAVIDVWYNYQKPDAPEPWPSNRPFDKLDNVILSAHESGWTMDQVDRRWDFIAANIQRVARGEPPLNLLFHGEQSSS